MNLKMINPFFQAKHYGYGGSLYTLTFCGWEGIGSIDDDGKEFWYEVEADSEIWNRADTLEYGYSWFFTKVYEDDSVSANFSNSEMEVVINYMMDIILNERIGRSAV